MKTLTFTLLIAFTCSFGFAQIANKDSLKKILETSKVDSIKFKALTELSSYYRIRYPDTSIVYANKALAIATKSKDIRKISLAQNLLSRVLTYMGNYPMSLNYAFESQINYEILKDTLGMINSISIIGLCFKEQGDIQNALKYTLNAKRLEDTYNLNHKERSISKFGFYSILSSIYEKNNQLDLAIAYADTLLKYGRSQSAMLYILGRCYSKKGQYEKAMSYYKQVIPIASKREYHKDLIETNTGIAYIFKERRQLDSAIYYCQKALSNPYGKLIPKYQLEASSMITNIYESQHKTDSAFKYLKQTITLKDTLFNQGKTIAIQNLIFKEEQKKKELEEAELKFQNRLKIYGLIGGLVVLLLVALLLWRNNRHKQKAFNLLQTQKKETDSQKIKVEQTLEKLKSTQAQLIQKEKLASLGELTAGIAHEIQNPLNFVNNFSEMSVELIEELKSPLTPKGGIEEEELLSDITQNLQKISHHGKRASSIVKGMLEHSRTSTGIKELTDINKLADEYLRLSYHGIRAKDSSFNSDYQTDFDENLPKIEVIPQDMGRVLLNLINNAFWAVKTVEKPLVTVKTEHLDKQIIIKVTDNGTGMSEDIKVKIFQPFFTTKPTGQGTGLGLSLAYDIVTKGHGGTIKCESTEGIGSEFTITLHL